MLQTLKTMNAQALYWVQPKAMEKRFELRSADQQYAALHFPSAFGSLATASTMDGTWTYKRVGFFSTRITVRAEGSETDLAIFKPKWTGTHGVLEFAMGQTYLWNTANFWGTRFQFTDANGSPLVNFHLGADDWKLSDIFKTQARMEINPGAVGIADLPILATIGFYLLILYQEDSSAATTAAVVT